MQRREKREDLAEYTEWASSFPDFPGESSSLLQKLFGVLGQGREQGNVPCISVSCSRKICVHWPELQGHQTETVLGSRRVGGKGRTNTGNLALPLKYPP